MGRRGRSRLRRERSRLRRAYVAAGQQGGNKGLSLRGISSMVDSVDGWGQTRNSSDVACVAGTCTFSLPALSLSVVA